MGTLGVMGRIRTGRLSAKMKKEAVGLGLCEQWQGEWADDASKDDMAEKFVMGQDFCIEHDWPGVEVIKRNFGDVMHRHGVYADETFEAEGLQSLIMVGRCEGKLKVDGRGVSSVYVRHNSRLHVEASGDARVFVRLYDKAAVEVESSGGARVFVYTYSEGTKVSGSYFKLSARPQGWDTV